MKKILLVIVMLVMSTSSWAEANPALAQSRETAEQLLKALKIEQRINESLQTQKKQYDRIKENLYADNRQKDLMEEYDRMLAQREEAMNWEKIKHDYIDALVETFSPQELKDVLKFVNSPSGTAVVDKFPELTMKIMTISMKHMYPESMRTTSRSYAGAQQKGTLRTLATAAETYATANGGKYPVDMAQLTGAQPPYMIKNYCGVEQEGHRFECKMSQEGYVFTAAPIGDKADVKPAYTITTGGVLTETPMDKPNEEKDE